MCRTLSTVFNIEYTQHVGTEGTICIVAGITTVSSLIFIKQLCAVKCLFGGEK